MNKKIIIIGKRSNLSICLKSDIENSIIISSNEIKKLENIISKYKEIDIIYNSSFLTNLLNDPYTDPIIYSNYSFHYLSRFIGIFQRYHEKINSIIYTSSSSIYGENKFAKENDEIKITNLYSALKASSEYLLEKYLGDKKINLIYARVFNMYGGNDRFSVISKRDNCIKNNKTMYLYNRGNIIRDYIYINDVVKAYKLILESKFKGKINISTGIGLKVNKIIEMIENTYNKKLNIIHKNDNGIKISIGCNDILTNQIKLKKYTFFEDYLKNGFL